MAHAADLRAVADDHGVCHMSSHHGNPLLPQLRRPSFTWSIDEVRSPLTLWNCLLCGTVLPRTRPWSAIARSVAGSRFCSTLRDEREEFRWCAACGKLTDG